MKNRLLFNGLSLILLLSFCSKTISAQGDQTAIQVKIYYSGGTNGAWLHLPDDYKETSEKYPLLVFLHGVGEGGTNVNAVLAHGVPKMIANGAKMQYTVNGKLFKFIVVSPQIPNGWANEENVQSVIDDMKARYRVDENRVYLTGLSAGGAGTWNYLASGKKFADNLAALVPVSAAALGDDKLDGLCVAAASNVAVWALGGDQGGDRTFLRFLNDYTQRINNCNPKVKAITTVYAGNGHDDGTWDKAYDPDHKYQNPNIYEWMLQYNRGVTATPPVQIPVAVAGPDQQLKLPSNTITLDGSSSTSPNGTIKTYEWTEITGPAPASITSPTSPKVTIQNLVAGTYQFQLKITDVAGATATATTTVIVAAAATTSCNCKFTIKPDVNGVATVSASALGNVQPGDTVCVQSGQYVSMMLSGFVGTAAKPIVFINCGGRVTIGNNGNYGLGFTDSKYFKITGSGSNDKYGFLVDGGGSPLLTGMAVGKGCTDYEVEKIEIMRSGIGLFAKINPDCDPNNQAPNFEIRNVKLHDLYVHDTEVEGLYIGNTAPNGTEMDCNGQTINALPPRIYNLKLYNVITKNTGWDGIQVSTVPEGGEIYNNQVTDYGMSKTYGQNAGIILGGSANAIIHHNIVVNGSGPGIQIFGIGQIKLYDNIVSGAGIYTADPGLDDGIFIDNRPNLYPDRPLQIYAFNNTVINSQRNGIRFINTNNTNATGNLFYNNLIVKVGSTGYGDRDYLNVAGGIDNVQSNNLYIANIADVKFVDAAANDFRLQTGSPAIDGGKDLTSLGVTNDFDYNTRPYGAAFDRGAFEYNGGVAANKPPLADAGNAISVTLPAGLTLDGSGSSDPDGSITGYKWTQVSGPNTAGISQSTSIKTAVTNLAAGVYTFQLQVTDNRGGTATATVKVTVIAANIAPVANAGGAISITLPVSTATLDGAGSTDADGTISAYKWTEVSGPGTAVFSQATAAKTSVSNLVAGVYTFQLQVTDNRGGTASATVKVTVIAANVPPVADAGNNVSITLPVSTAALDGSGSTDADGTITAYKWTQVSGPGTATFSQATAAKTNVSKLIAGVYAFQLEITDNKGATATSTVQVTVNAENAPSNIPPVANAGENVNITLPVSTAALDGSGSTDEDGTVSAYKWTQVSGPGTATFSQAAAAKTNVSKLVAGVYTFQLQVTDNKGATATSTVQVTVNAENAPANMPPVANAGSNANITLPVSTAALDGSGSTDADGTISAYKWTQVSGPGTATFSQAAAAKTNVSKLIAGVYTFRLQVTDNKGATATATVQVAVNTESTPANLPPVARPGNDFAVELPSGIITLDGGASSDQDGYIVTYLWQQISGPTAGLTNEGAVKSFVAITAVGTYVFRLTVTDNLGSTAAAQITITVTHGQGHTEDDIRLYPNPASTNIRLEGEVNNVQYLDVFIYNISGRLEKNFKIVTPSSWREDIDVSNLAPGAYLMKITDGKSFKVVKRFLKIGA